MSARIQELQGTTRPFTHYNNQFKASFELEDGIAGEMMESLRGKDAQASIPKLAKFADANLSELQQQMRTLRNPHMAKALETAQRDARALIDANDAVGGRNLKSVYRLFLQNPQQAWPGLVVMAAGHGIGLPFPLPQIMGAAATGARLGMRAKAAAGEVRLKLPRLSPIKIQTKAGEKHDRQRPIHRHRRRLQ
jgi:hypothetical protein